VTRHRNGGSDSGTWLRVELRSHDHTCTLVLEGSLCTTSIAALEAQVDQLGCIPCDDVTVDLQGLHALDAVGAKVLLGLRHYVDGRGGSLQITRATPAMATALRRYALEYCEADDEWARGMEEESTLLASPTPADRGEGGQPLLL
jgi:anti-anti-sigma regulatory factor